jgi:hypothetical protein
VSCHQPEWRQAREDGGVCSDERPFGSVLTVRSSEVTPKMAPIVKRKSPEFTVPEVWRTIVKKNERQGSKRYDVLICRHAVPANDNTYRRARSCPECRLKVQEYADQLRAAKKAA